jgi:hypothetical protein
VKQRSLSLQHVKYLPKKLSHGVLYVSLEYAVAGHLCACGCGNKVIVPLNSASWSFSERNGLPTLWPSIGNWQLPCLSHYLITDGKVVCAEQWTDSEIIAGRKAEQARREAYYATKDRERSIWRRVRQWIRRLIWF